MVKQHLFMCFGNSPKILALFLSYQALMPKHSLLKILAISVERLQPFLNLLITDLMHNWPIKII